MSTRGQRILQRVVTASDGSKDTTLKKKGRNNELLERRNDKLICRYYYYARILNLRIDMILNRLESEFDLSQRRVLDIVAENQGKLYEMSKKQIPVKQLADTYPAYNWSVNKN